MRGAAKWFNTEQDVINSMAVDPDGTKRLLRALLDGRFAWFDTGPAIGDGLTDATHKVVEYREDMGQTGPAELRQYELRADPQAWIFRIGLTVEKVNAYLEA